MKGAAGNGVKLIFSAEDQLFRSPTPGIVRDYVRARLQNQAHSAGPLNFESAILNRSPLAPALLTVRFLTPTHLTFEGQVVKRPEFHHLFKRVRDRVNALSSFYGDGPIDADFKGLGERAEKVRTVSSKIEWAERFRTSSKTHQRHELSGFVGECTYEFPPDDYEISNFEFLEWLAFGELVHVGKHSAWGNGWYQLYNGGSERSERDGIRIRSEIVHQEK